MTEKQAVRIRKATLDDLSAIAKLAMIEVFQQNRGALRLYRRLGYSVAEKRQVVPHPCHPYTGELVLLTRPFGAAGADSA